MTAERVDPRSGSYVGEAAPSPAGPLGDGEPVHLPPADSGSPLLQSLRFGVRPIAFNLRHHRQFGDVWRINILARREGFVVTCHPDHVRSLFKAKPDDAPSLTGESPLRPILGANSILTSVGARHMRQRKLLLPPFHGEAVERYVAMITEVAERAIDRWPVSEAFALAPRMSAITLDVIMSGIFGIEGSPAPGTAGHRLRQTIRRLLGASTNPLFQVIELQNIGRREPTGILKTLLGIVDRQLLAIIAERRAQAADLEAGERTDILSLLIAARDEDGAPLTDRELRDELLSLVLAGHETTANSLAWTFERLLRTPSAYDALRERVRAGGPAGEAYVEATIHEAMRNRPVIPMIVRKVNRPWRFGDYTLPARTPVAVSIVALHHREDLYPDPLSFRPERFLEHEAGYGTRGSRSEAASGGVWVRHWPWPNSAWC